MGRLLLRPEAYADPLAEPVRRYLLTGDEEALDLVVRETRLRLLAAARRIGAPQDAEDAVQSAYLSLVRKKGEDLRAPVFPWLLTAVIRIAYRRKAAARREEGTARRLARPLEGPSPFTLAAGRELEERLARAVGRLPASYRDPVVLHYLSGLSTRETAGLLDLPEATVRTRLRRARLLLRSRVPAGLLHGLFVVPWLLEDALEGAGASLGIAATGGLAMKAGGVAVVALGAAALGTLAGTRLAGGGADPGPAPAREPAAAEARFAAERQSLENTHRSALRALQEERDEARKRAEAAEERASAAEKAAAARIPAPGTPPAPAAAKGPAFSFPEYDEVLAKVEWKSVGESTSAMVPLMTGIRETIRSGEKLDLKAIGRLQQLNGNLVRAALEVNEKLPGAGVNGSYTHPAFMVNAYAATLEAAGLPLTAGQAEALGRLGREFSDREAQRVRGYDEKALELQKVLEEGETKDRFFEQASGILSAEQREAVSPAAIRGLTTVDLFSSGLLWSQHLAPLPSKDAEAYAAQVERVIVQRAGFPEERRGELKEAIRAWAADLPAEWFAADTENLLGVQPIVRISLVEEVARRQIPLMRRIAEDMGVPEACAKNVREAGIVLFPMVRKGN